MVKNDIMVLDFKIYELHAEICKIFSNARRLFLLDVLQDKELTVSELSERTGISPSSISQHLSLLRQLDLIKTRKAGQHVHYQISDLRMLQAFNLMRKILLSRLEKGGRLAEKTIDKLSTLQ